MKIGLRLTIYLSGRKVLERESRSFVQNFARVLLGFASAAGGVVGNVRGVFASASVVGLDGTPQTVWIEWYGGTYSGGTPMAMGAPRGDDSYGIVVGSGTDPVSYSDYRLGKQIRHGTGPHQLDYGTTTVTPVTVDTENKASFSISRVFTNRSGSPVTVSECGIIARSYWKDSGGVRQDIKYLIVRDLIEPPITVPPDGTLTIVYTFEVSL